MIIAAQRNRRAAINILDGISDPQGRTWQVKSVTYGPTTYGYKFRAWEIMVPVTGGALHVDKDGWVRAVLDDPAVPMPTGQHTLTVQAEANDGVPLYTSLHGDVLERGPGTTITTTVTIDLAAATAPWSPADLSPAFWLDPSDASTHIVSAMSGEDLPSRFRVGVDGLTDAAGGPRTLTVTTPYTNSSQVRTIDMESQRALSLWGDPFSFDQPVTARTLVFVIGSINQDYWRRNLWLHTAGQAVGVRWEGLVGASGTMRVDGHAHADQQRETAGAQIYVVEMDAAHDWTGLTNPQSMYREMLLFPGTLTPEQRERLEGYLAHKHDLVRALPHDHAYRTSLDGQNTITVPPTARFGGATRAGYGGVPVGRGRSITAGDPSGHWQIRYGRLCPTAAFVAAAPAPGTTYSLTISGAPCAVTVGDAATAHVADVTEIRFTLDALKNASGPRTVMLRNGRYGSIRGLSLSNSPAHEIVIRSERPRGALITAFKVDDTNDKCHLKDLRFHYPYQLAQSQSKDGFAFVEGDLTLTRCESHGYWLDQDWGAHPDVGGAGNWLNYRWMLLKVVDVQRVYDFVGHGSDECGAIRECYGAMFYMCLGDGPSAMRIAEDYTFCDNPYDKRYVESGKHADAIQNSGSPARIRWARVMFYASPALKNGQANRGFFLEAAGGDNSPSQNNGVVSHGIIAVISNEAAWSLNAKAQPGLLLHRKALIVDRDKPGARNNGRINNLQGGKHVWNTDQSALTNTDDSRKVFSFADAFAGGYANISAALDAINPGQPCNRHHILTALTPLENGTLHLGGGDYAGPVGLDGDWTPDVLPLAAALGQVPALSVTPTGTGVSFVATPPPEVGAGIASYEFAWFGYDEVPPGLKSREHYSLEEDTWLWNATGFDQTAWSKKVGFAAADNVVVAGGRTIRCAARAVDVLGRKSSWSSPDVVVTMSTTPPAYEQAPILTPGPSSFTVLVAREEDGGSPITSRDLRWSPAGAGTWTTISGVSYPYELTGVSGQVDVQVRATNALGTGEWSLTATAETLAATALLDGFTLRAISKPGTASVARTYSLNRAVASNKKIMVMVGWFSTPQRTITSITARNSDGTEAVAMNGVGGFTQNSAVNQRRQVFWAQAPAAGWTNLEIRVEFSGTTRSVLVGLVEFVSSADLSTAIVTMSDPAGPTPSVDIQTQAGAVVLFSFMVTDTQAFDPATITPALPDWLGPPVFGQPNSSTDLLMIAAATLTGPQSPALQTVQIGSANFLQPVQSEQMGLVAVVVPQP